MSAALPKNIREHIARAKGYLSRGELPRALETISLALREGGSVSLPRAVHAAMEARFNDFLQELSNHPAMLPLLDPQGLGKAHPLAYQRGKEGVLATVLEGLGKILTEAHTRQADDSRQAAHLRRDSLITTGLEALSSGDFGRGRSFLRRVVAEFGDQPGLCMAVGKQLLDAAQYTDAGQVFEVGMSKAPREAEAYSAAVHAYMLAGEYEKAEAVFKKILRQFGGHASTYGRMAQMYRDWHKPAEAEDFAARALHMDKEQAEALEVMRDIEK